MENLLRAALLDWLRADPALAALNAVEEESPLAASPPWLGIVASAAGEWGAKEAPGREIRVALELHTRGDDPEGDGALVRAIDAEGHTVANHTFYHNNLTSLPPENVYREWRLCNEAVERVTGKKPRFARPPGGRYNTFVAERANEEGLRIVLWTNNPGDYAASLDGPSLARKVLSRAKEGDIVLLHVGVAPTIDALPEIIDGYRRKGFSFVTVDEMR